MRARLIYCRGCGRRRIGRRSRGAYRSPRGTSRRTLLGIVKDDAEGVAGAAVDATDSVAEIDPIVAARAFHGSIARGEDDRLALICGNDFGFGLCARLLLHQKELAAFPVTAWLAE